MRGFIYRLGTAIKEFGERNGKGWIARIGIKLRSLV